MAWGLKKFWQRKRQHSASNVLSLILFHQLVKVFFRVQAGLGLSLSSAWRCSKTGLGPGWPASWQSGWRHGLVVASALHRLLVSAEAKKKKTPPKTADQVRGQAPVATMHPSRQDKSWWDKINKGNFVNILSQTFEATETLARKIYKLWRL